ncbi:MAG: hypothetical protein EOP53_20970 [Sphingobacteriales bacterium]|nr:MAG: hypothetical protein EOP53_20970 [Sphingobacteriales bacterium]
MYHPTLEYPLLILELNFKADILKWVYANNSIFEQTTISKNFLELTDISSAQKAKQFLEEVINHTAVLDWEVSFRFDDKIDVMVVSGFKMNDHIFVIISGKNIGTQMLYDEMAMINNEQLNSIRMLRKQLNQMALENNALRDKYAQEIEMLRNELAKYKTSYKA